MLLDVRTGDIAALKLASFRLEQHLLDAQLGHGSGIRIRDSAQLGCDALAKDYQLILAGRVKARARVVVLHFSLLCWCVWMGRWELLKLLLLLVMGTGMKMRMWLSLLLLGVDQAKRGIINNQLGLATAAALCGQGNNASVFRGLGTVRARVLLRLRLRKRFALHLIILLLQGILAHAYVSCGSEQ